MRDGKHEAEALLGCLVLVFLCLAVWVAVELILLLRRLG